MPRRFRGAWPCSSRAHPGCLAGGAAARPAGGVAVLFVLGMIDDRRGLSAQLRVAVESPLARRSRCLDADGISV